MFFKKILTFNVAHVDAFGHIDHLDVGLRPEASDAPTLSAHSQHAAGALGRLTSLHLRTPNPPIRAAGMSRPSLNSRPLRTRTRRSGPLQFPPRHSRLSLATVFRISSLLPKVALTQLRHLIECFEVFTPGLYTRYTKTSCIVYRVSCIVYFNTYTMGSKKYTIHTRSLASCIYRVFFRAKVDFSIQYEQTPKSAYYSSYVNK